MVDPKGRQAAFNATSRGLWDAFTSHRRAVTALLGHGGGRVCILGAGNGNDLDLPALLAAHREVHLVDIDRAAVEFAATTQGVASHPALHLHGGIDVTGPPCVWSPFTSFRPSDLEAMTEYPASRVAAIFPGGFDLVASTCLLSQLMETTRHSLGDAHPSLGKVERAIRAGHLRLLARLAAPGGAAVLVTEVASSAEVPGLGAIPKADLPALLSRLGREGNYFRWVHPSDLTAAVRSDPAIRSRVVGVASATPWRWKLFAQLYLVSAITIQFSAAGVR